MKSIAPGNERDLYSLESSINSAAPVSLQAHSASKAVRHAGALPHDASDDE
jgi:hypothetical protein